jgi:hypothetical protein
MIILAENLCIAVSDMMTINISFGSKHINESSKITFSNFHALELSSQFTGKIKTAFRPSNLKSRTRFNLSASTEGPCHCSAFDKFLSQCKQIMYYIPAT